nr:uncharacterized protein LOC127489484 [Oryctolagus cuniculus]
MSSVQLELRDWCPCRQHAVVTKRFMIHFKAERSRVWSGVCGRWSRRRRRGLAGAGRGEKQHERKLAGDRGGLSCGSLPESLRRRPPFLKSFPSGLAERLLGPRLWDYRGEPAGGSGLAASQQEGPTTPLYSCFPRACVSWWVGLRVLCLRLRPNPAPRFRPLPLHLDSGHEVLRRALTLLWFSSLVSNTRVCTWCPDAFPGRIFAPIMPACLQSARLKIHALRVCFAAAGAGLMADGIPTAGAHAEEVRRGDQRSQRWGGQAGSFDNTSLSHGK